ncbi:MAG: DUF4136 domain-containing protein [Odoribacter sp.]|nr:DUF4136 domain-containing protein [Odoribacter sp.]MDY3033641.1 DUF4136 domain-containing protein [Odoribacter sp.]
MKHLGLMLTVSLALFMSSCYPEGADTVEDYDVAITNYDKGADFSSFSTFAIPDTIVYFANDKNAKLDHQFDEQIIQVVTDNFIKRGYTKVENPETASFIVTVSAFSNINYSYYIDNWYNNWNWYWGWWPGGAFNPYYPWYPVSVYAYQSGSVVIDMISTTARSDNKVNVIWSGIADGLLQGTQQSIINRVNTQLNQCFIQSPYLKK